MSFTATANFADALAGHGSTSLDNVFHAAIINNGISTNGINIWSINGSDSIKKPLRSAATEEQLAICEVFPETHAPVLVDAWKQLRCANALLPPPRTKFLVVNRRSAAAQPRLGPTPRQSNSAVVGGGWESAEIKEQRRREYLKPLQEAGWTDNILEQMKQLLFSSSSIPPTLVLNDDDELQMVMPDFSGQKENVSKVPVLVSLQRHGEEYSNSNRSAGMVPIENTNGALVAYSVHGTIVRIIQEQGKRKFSCTHCCGSKCSHARDATKYANQYGVGCINGDCLDGTKDGDDDRHKYLQLKDEHYHLPTGLTWPKSPYVADAIQRLLFNGKSVFKDRVRGVGYALAPQAGGPCSCVGGYYDSGSYDLIVDGTSLTMQGDRFSGHPINAVLEEAEIVRQKHNTNSRAFFNVLEDRKDLNRIAQGYAKAIKAIEDTRLSTLPKLSDCDKKLEEKAGSFGLDLALKWVDEKVQAKQLTNLDRKVI
ncbi:hypothetical protein KSW81_000057 [Nannochloris sp. 'desiccata']|nr:hypothetical protein KSW81_000057 [Chlorella desiccata (nom. nud.)]